MVDLEDNNGDRLLIAYKVQFGRPVEIWTIGDVLASQKCSFQRFTIIDISSSTAQEQNFVIEGQPKTPSSFHNRKSFSNWDLLSRQKEPAKLMWFHGDFDFCSTFLWVYFLLGQVVSEVFSKHAGSDHFQAY